MKDLFTGKTSGTSGSGGDRGPRRGSSPSVSTKCEQVAVLAKAYPEQALTTLAHHIDLDWLMEAYRRTRKDGATGVDKVTASRYAQDLETNLRGLLERFKSGRYHAPPVRRHYIPKRDGSRRALGIPTFEDKVLQRAVAMVLEPVYEHDFRACSHGFRPGRSAHTALECLRKGLMRMGGGVVLEVDIASYFDTIPHDQLREVIHARIGDGTIRRTLGKWLRAGVLEDGKRYSNETGTPQGGVASPLLANIYLHTVLDSWFEDEIRPLLTGQAFLIRYADDAVILFSDERDARRVAAVLPKRFERFGLTLHPEKTRLIPFQQPRPEEMRCERAGSFDFLGFTHYWARSRRGYWVVKRKTARDRLRDAIRTVKDWCRYHRHDPVEDQHRMLCLKLRGHYQYYGITGNSAALSRFNYHARAAWHKWLGRRHQRSMKWEAFNALVERYPLPQPVAVHSMLRRTASP